MHPSPPMSEEIKAGFYPGFERRWRQAELVGRSLMLLTVAATLLGVLGGGPVSLWTRHAHVGTLDVEYAPIVRFGTPTGLVLRAAVPAGQRQVAIGLGQDIVRRYGLQSVYPAPVQSQSGADGAMRLVFAAPPGATAVTVQVGGMPASGGVMRLAARLDDGTRAQWSQLVLP